jgi:hypothetical protein
LENEISNLETEYSDIISKYRTLKDKIDEVKERKNVNYTLSVSKDKGYGKYVTLKVKYKDKWLTIHLMRFDDYEKLSPEEKIKVVLELVYINLANTKSESFDLMTRKRPEGLEGFLEHLGITQPKKRSKELERFRDKFISQLAKYEDREIDFFKDECERFNYDTTKLIKKISKIYSLIENKDTTNESILDWGLHEKIMEKKYGKRKIDTEYNFKKR